MPSDDVRDATMLSGLSMGGRNILNANIIHAQSARFEGMLSADKIGANRMMFETRPSIDGAFAISGEAYVSGGITSDAKDMIVSGTLTLGQDARFSNVTADDLWVNNLRLSGLTVNNTGKIPILSIGRVLDMTGGQISATLVNVGFSGSVTPHLSVAGKIVDATDPGYYWDTTSGAANLSDMSFPILNQLMRAAVASEGRATQSYAIMSSVAANQNATATDFINAMSEIKKQVTAKFHQLNLE